MQKQEKIIVAGSRHFKDYALAERKLSLLLPAGAEVVSGKAPGADTLGELYATKHGHPIKTFPADWTKLGPKAGPIRNHLMVMYADRAIVFWDGKSKGTANLLDLLKRRRKKVKIIAIAPDTRPKASKASALPSLFD